MSECLSHEALRRYASGALAPEELLRTDAHVASCASCRTQLLGPSFLSQAARSLAGKVRWNPRIEFNCLDDEQAAAYVAGTLDPTDREIAESHMELCQPCVDDIRSLREFRTVMSTYPDTVYAPEARPSMLARLAARFPSLVSPQWAYASAAVAVLVAVMLFVYQLTVTSRLREQVRVLENQVGGPPAKPQTVPQGVESTNRSARKTEEQLAAAPDQRESTPQKVELAQNQPRQPTWSAGPRPRAPATTIVTTTPGRSSEESLVTIKNEDGTLGVRLVLPPGVSVPRELSQETAELLRTGVVTPTEPVQLALAQLSSEGEMVRSGDEESPLPLSPVRTLALSTRPTLRWKAVKGASGYVVSLFTAEPRRLLWEKEIAVSDHLEFPADQVALRPGETYVWTVAAQIAGQPSYSNLAKFRVLGESRRAEVQKLSKRYAGLQTVLAALYEREGLYDEAAEALEELVRRNPGSEPVKRLLAALRQRHREASVKQP